MSERSAAFVSAQTSPPGALEREARSQFRQVWAGCLGLAAVGFVLSLIEWTMPTGVASLGTGIATLLVATLGVRSARRARAAQILVSGEPTDALDPATQREVDQLRTAVERAAGRPISGGGLALAPKVESEGEGALTVLGPVAHHAASAGSAAGRASRGLGRLRRGVIPFAHVSSGSRR